MLFIKIKEFVQNNQLNKIPNKVKDILDILDLGKQPSIIMKFLFDIDWNLMNNFHLGINFRI